MERQKRGVAKIIPNHALDKIGNPSKAYLPPSRPILTSYALEYGGALRMIRVSIVTSYYFLMSLFLGYLSISYRKIHISDRK
jgi:hypothetical protein